MSEKKLIPKFRFKEFKYDWEQFKLGQIFEQTSKYLNPKEENIELWSLTVEKGLTPKTKRYNREFLVKKQDKFKAVRNNEFIYNPMNMTLGAVDLNLTGKTVAVSGYYITMKAKETFESKYFSIWLRTSLAIKMYKLYATGSLIERQRVQFPTLSQIKAYVPYNEEQIKIGNFFKQLDNTIILQQQLLNDYKQLKKAMLQNMFPQKGETVPKVRFAGFTDKRKQDKIKDLLIERNERSGDGELISVTINSGIVKTADLDRTDNSSKDKSNYKKVEKGDIAYNSMRMWQGASGLSKYTGIVSPAYTIVIPNERVSPLFISYKFKVPSMIQTFQANSQGLTSDTWNLKYPLLKKIKIKIPELEEQVKIGNFFKQLDETIELHQKKLETYQELKKAMLQRMFV
ncbi:restriction endonuclease subunit S [Listeria monocytogenes]|nr:restriction endonuclease subunit S [Listeria monocytogenes]EJB2521799.1 restriction endonuclease subunit S [Listeria monocytogenes]EJB2690131.1 restriction endonuclease subunit S [Listeria monocytogenes]EJE4582930.1 restriction endonuclease subunit S [Listeria monocytogenes]